MTRHEAIEIFMIEFGWHHEHPAVRKPCRLMIDRALAKLESRLGVEVAPYRTADQIAAIIETYPEEWRRWCDAPEHGGCACSGCLRQPAPSTVRGDPEHLDFPNVEHQLFRSEVVTP